MQPTIVDKGSILLLGFSFFGDPFQLSGEWTEENEIGRLWQRFMDYLADCGDRIHHIENREASYEVHVYHPETETKGHFEVFVGLAVTQLEDVPVELVVKILPPATYALLTLRGQQISSDWYMDFTRDWIPGSGYQLIHGYSFQYYDRRFKGVEDIEQSELDVYIPIRTCPA